MDGVAAALEALEELETGEATALIELALLVVCADGFGVTDAPLAVLAALPPPVPVGVMVSRGKVI